MKELRMSMVLNILRTLKELNETWLKEGQENLKFEVHEEEILIETPNRDYRRGLEELLEHQTGIIVNVKTGYKLVIKFY